MKQSLLGYLTRLSMLLTSLSFLVLPYGARAQNYYDNNDSVQGYLVAILDFINNDILPLIFGIALLFFIWNAARYFILDTEKDREREKAKQFALYGIAAFVILVSLWGIVNLLVNGLGINDNRTICPDYLQSWCDSNSGGSNYGLPGGY